MPLAPGLQYTLPEGLEVEGLSIIRDDEISYHMATLRIDDLEAIVDDRWGSWRTVVKRRHGPDGPGEWYPAEAHVHTEIAWEMQRRALELDKAEALTIATHTDPSFAPNKGTR